MPRLDWVEGQGHDRSSEPEAPTRQGATVLLVATEAVGLPHLLRSMGFDTDVYRDVASARLRLARRDIAVAVVDQDQIGAAGIRELIDASATTEVVALSSGGPAGWREALLAGAGQWFERPLPDVGRLVHAVQLALTTHRSLQVEPGLSPGAQEGLVWRSAPMSRVALDVRRLAPTRVSVLVTGETGTGKEGIARALHDCSGRRGQFVEINCGAVPPDLLESELFGHEKGAFTGATERRTGQVAAAAHGTLFLDEIGDLRLDLQVKLNRFLDTGRYRPVGASGVERDSHVRVVAATHRNLKQLVSEGKFREDLYHRLIGATIRVPALRDRRDDIPLLVAHFLDVFQVADSLGVGGVAPDALDVLVRAAWTGNVRQLRNVVRASMLAALPSPRIERKHLPEELTIEPATLPGLPEGLPLGEFFDLPWAEARVAALEAFARAYVRERLARHGSVAEAARSAGMAPSNFSRLKGRLGDKADE